MDYAEAILRLEEKLSWKGNPSLDRVRRVLAAFGNPQENLKCIHIAGTNGKGSAAAMFTSILMEAGFRVGTYISPHLEEYTERIQMNRLEISMQDFADTIDQVLQKESVLCTEGAEKMNLFETLTCAAFLYFKKQSPDFVVLETGLGGAFDATNIIQKPLISVIMSISLDHTALLGDTVEQIASEKAGIIKQDCPVAVYPNIHSVTEILQKKAQSCDAPFFYASAKIKMEHCDFFGSQFSLSNPWISFSHLRLPLAGTYQPLNCATVLTALSALNKIYGISFSEEVIRNGLKHCKWPGRMEVCGVSPLLILDGAHNADGISQVASTMYALADHRKITLVMGVLSDKAYEKMVTELLPFADQIILTEPPTKRTLSADTLKDLFQNKGKECIICPEVKLALDKAYEITKQEDIILCCGSLYMIGEMKHILNRTRREIENNAKF